MESDRSEIHLPGNRSKTWHFLGWLSFFLVFTTGVLNLFFVHPVPAFGYMLLSLVYLPPATIWFSKITGLPVHPLIKIALGIILFFFTLGVSDLGDLAGR
jgi:hypothetical protein